MFPFAALGFCVFPFIAMLVDMSTGDAIAFTMCGVIFTILFAAEKIVGALKR